MPGLCPRGRHLCPYELVHQSVRMILGRVDGERGTEGRSVCVAYDCFSLTLHQISPLDNLLLYLFCSMALCMDLHTEDGDAAVQLRFVTHKSLLPDDYGTSRLNVRACSLSYRGCLYTCTEANACRYMHVFCVFAAYHSEGIFIMTSLCRGRYPSGLSIIQTYYFDRILQSVLCDYRGHSNHGRAYSWERSEARSEHVSLSVPTYMVWGANTGVGKTLVSAALAREVSSKEVSVLWPQCRAHVEGRRSLPNDEWMYRCLCCTSNPFKPGSHRIMTQKLW